MFTYASCNLFFAHSSCHICTAGDDHQALIWDIQQMPRPIEDPILAYTAAEGEVNQIQWGPTQPDWIVRNLTFINLNIFIYDCLFHRQFATIRVAKFYEFKQNNRTE